MSFTLGSHIIIRKRRPIHYGDATFAVLNGPFVIAFRPLVVILDFVGDGAVIVDDGLDPCLVAFLFGQPPGTHQRHLDWVRGIWVRDGARPDPCDHGMFHAMLVLDLRIQIPDLLERLITQKPAIVSDVIGQTAGLVRCLRAFGRVDTRLVEEYGGEFDQRLVDCHRQRVQIRCLGFKSESLRLQRDGSASRKRVQHIRHDAVVRVEDRLSSLLVQVCVMDILPFCQTFHKQLEAFAFPVLLLHGRETVRMSRRVIHKLGKQDGTRGRQRATRPV